MLRLDYEMLGSFTSAMNKIFVLSMKSIIFVTKVSNFNIYIIKNELKYNFKIRHREKEILCKGNESRW
jgi:hypothetical protein